MRFHIPFTNTRINIKLHHLIVGALAIVGGIAWWRQEPIVANPSFAPDLSLNPIQGASDYQETSFLFPPISPVQEKSHSEFLHLVQDGTLEQMAQFLKKSPEEFDVNQIDPRDGLTPINKVLIHAKNFKRKVYPLLLLFSNGADITTKEIDNLPKQVSSIEYTCLQEIFRIAYFNTQNKAHALKLAQLNKAIPSRKKKSVILIGELHCNEGASLLMQNALSFLGEEGYKTFIIERSFIEYDLKKLRGRHGGKYKALKEKMKPLHHTMVNQSITLDNLNGLMTDFDNAYLDKLSNILEGFAAKGEITVKFMEPLRSFVVHFLEPVMKAQTTEGTDTAEGRAINEFRETTHFNTIALAAEQGPVISIGGINHISGILKRSDQFYRIDGPQEKQHYLAVIPYNAKDELLYYNSARIVFAHLFLFRIQELITEGYNPLLMDMTTSETSLQAMQQLKKRLKFPRTMENNFQEKNFFTSWGFVKVKGNDYAVSKSFREIPNRIVSENIGAATASQTPRMKKHK